MIRSGLALGMFDKGWSRRTAPSPRPSTRACFRLRWTRTRGCTRNAACPRPSPTSRHRASRRQPLLRRAKQPRPYRGADGARLAAPRCQPAGCCRRAPTHDGRGPGAARSHAASPHNVAGHAGCCTSCCATTDRRGRLMTCLTRHAIDGQAAQPPAPAAQGHAHPRSMRRPRLPAASDVLAALYQISPAEGGAPARCRYRA